MRRRRRSAQRLLYSNPRICYSLRFTIYCYEILKVREALALFNNRRNERSVSIIHACGYIYVVSMYRVSPSRRRDSALAAHCCSITKLNSSEFVTASAYLLLQNNHYR
ncbi:unnamed protein product [Euphydryas editha]|uniref:Uncharacterized protein n=1 Tax=Euphydryas editha TaxID=104508 RepID=A0AAU9TR24_EUPED|nr:unnamed protein product [Euphydryas editha]